MEPFSPHPKPLFGARSEACADFEGFTASGFRNGPCSNATSSISLAQAQDKDQQRLLSTPLPSNSTCVSSSSRPSSPRGRPCLGPDGRLAGHPGVRRPGRHGDTRGRGAHPESYRKCKEHPLLLLAGGMPTTPSEDGDVMEAEAVALEVRAADAADAGRRVFARACACLKSGSNIGCEKDYCWKECGRNREWCWLADNGGTGAWTTCRSAFHCAGKAIGSDKRADCSRGNCGARGCSC
ncbi:hypothetical protein GGTG_06483 [Gaeumannomyces tritici R3-111a-1]|uniref:Uncharacterized protein n=1 Tax=Gaeumannomyces tritici (strain R3-111a-1) TaxID=644352 RepID=J3NYY2_GAET3|nr:hypothetical protein GGTG_06483 [Gaeumannomyces tritici R3-111a-1]EJT76565.1 hypothetical protein GGTG_06483 [Gaeumannomyces tritici R3-111a-1]